MYVWILGISLVIVASFVVYWPSIISGPSVSSSSTTVTSASSTTTTYPQTSPIHVLSVRVANLTVGGDLRFNVTFTNTGSVPIYFVDFCGTSLSFSVSPETSVQKQRTVQCLCATGIVRVDPGRNANAYAPTCASDFVYRIVQPGTVVANLTLNWSYDPSFSPPNFTPFSATFTFR